MRNFTFLFVNVILFFTHDLYGNDSDTYIKENTSRKTEKRILDLVDSVTCKLHKIYPNTVDYLKNNNLDFVSLEIYRRYQTDLFDHIKIYEFSPEKENWDKESVEISKVSDYIKDLNEAQAELLWRLIPVYVKENPDAKEEILQIIIEGMLKSRQRLCAFILKKADELKESTFKLRLLGIAWMQLSVLIQKDPENINNKEYIKCAEKLAIKCNKLSPKPSPDATKFSILFFALLDGIAIDKTLMEELYKKNSPENKKEIRELIEEVYSNCDQKLIIGNDNDFKKWLDEYKTGSILQIKKNQR